MPKGNQTKKALQESLGVTAKLAEFQRDSVNFFHKCKKPDRAEYMRIMQACAMGFVVMGFIGYLIKLVFIPINNIILSWMKKWPNQIRFDKRLSGHNKQLLER